jgi:glycine betaine/proline transport system permease protein
VTAITLRASPRIPVVPRWVWLLGTVAVGIVGYLLFAGQWTLPHDNDAATFRTINEIREWVDDNRNSNVILVVFVNGVRLLVSGVFEAFSTILHAVSWPGLTAIGASVAWVVGGWRMAALIAGGFLSFGLLGLWDRSVDTLALTLTAVVLALSIGIPVGIVAGRNDRFYAAIRPILDVMQILPTFVYLAPLALFFLIGPAAAAIATMIYAIPPAIRITAIGIREVSATCVEAATSLGSSGGQVLRKVQIPMARRTIIIGVNQTIMMALSMVVITALIDAPGLGKNILAGLQQSDVGLAFDAGVAIVIMAIMLDRLTTAASERADPAHGHDRTVRPPLSTRARIALVAATALVVILGIALVGDRDFPTDVASFSFRGPINDAVDWISLNLFDYTEAIKNAITAVLINPIETFLVNTPWWLILGLAVAIALVVGGVRPAIIAAVCLLAIAGIQMWSHSMATLAQVLVAAILTLAIGLALGIASARSDRFSAFLRPLLDAAQTMPAFVYLIPAVALFAPTRFTAIMAAVIYAVPPVIRLVEIGIRTVPATVREAAVSAGTTKRQLLWKVELPVARPVLLLAANQGIILVLAMVVVGGLVGAGALGYDVVAGFARRDFFGEGVAAGIAIVLLGITLDRITQGAGNLRRSNDAPAVPAGHA